MPSKTCNDCGKKFTAQTEGRAALALNMHIGRVHKRTIVAYGGRRARVHSGVIEGESQSGVTVITRPSLNTRARSVIEKPKRAYRRKVQQEVRVNFCPQCGCNLHAVAVGMATAHLS